MFRILHTKRGTRVMVSLERHKSQLFFKFQYSKPIGSTKYVISNIDQFKNVYPLSRHTCIFW